MDAIQLLKKDHRTVKLLFAQFDKLGDGATAQKKAIVQKITHELSIHAAIEEAILYPAARAAIKAKEDLVLEAYEEHHIVKVLLHELASLAPNHERYTAKVTVLKEAVEHHVEEEESDLFPALRTKLGKEKLEALGKALLSAKKLAPTRPHPDAPDAPPGSLIAGLPAAMIDRIRDLVSGATAPRTAARKKQGISVNATANRVARSAK